MSVLLRLFTALFAAGVFTAGDEDDPLLRPVWFAPRLFPVVPWFNASDVLEPGDPPVPLIVLPFESVLPAAPPALELAPPPAPEPEIPPALCAWASQQLPSTRTSTKVDRFMVAFIVSSSVSINVASFDADFHAGPLGWHSPRGDDSWRRGRL